MLRDRMTALHGNSDSESFVAAGLSGSMPGIVYYEFAALGVDQQNVVTDRADKEKMDEEQ